MHTFSALCAVFALVAVTATSAQGLLPDTWLGVRLGGGISSVTDAAPRQHTAFSFMAGPSCSFPIDPAIELQVELLYARRGYTYAEQDADDTRVHIALHYLDLPLTARFAVLQRQSCSLFVVMGGYAGLFLEADASADGPLPLPVHIDNSPDFDAGVIGALALDLPVAGNRLGFEARIAYGLVEPEQYDYVLVPPDSPPTAIEHQLSGSNIAVIVSASWMINLSR